MDWRYQMGPERKFRDKIMPKLKKIPDSWWESIQQMTIRGTPDILGCVKGNFVALELKAKKGKPSKLQELKIKKINEAGGVGRIVYPDNFDEIYKEILCLK